MRKSLISTALLIILISSLVTIPSATKAQEGYVPVARLEIDHPHKGVDVDPASDGTVVFSGTLHVSCQWPTTTEFETTYPSDWVVSVSPSSVGLPAGTQEADVNIVVKVPLETEREAGKVHIDGTTRTATPISYYTEFSQEVCVIVNRYYIFSIGSDKAYKEINPHSKTSYRLIIENRGNAVVRKVQVSIENIEELDGWVITLPEKLSISPHGDVNTTIGLEPPRDWTLWRDEVQRVQVSAEYHIPNVTGNVTGKVSASYPLYIRQRGTYIPGFDPMFLIICLGVVAILLRRKR